jgi:hypothetical protein
MRKILFRILIPGTLFVPVFYFSLVAGTTQTPHSYPLVCRGSTSATIWFKPERRLVLKFIKGTAPAASGLSPGECSWLDRGVSAGEPDMLVQQVPEGADEQPAYKWVSELRDADTYWSFDVYNDGQGQLIVTGSRRKSAQLKETGQQPTPAMQEPVRTIQAPTSSLPQAPGPVRPRQTQDPRLQAEVELPLVRSIRPSCTTNEFATLVICTTKGDCFVSQHPCFPYQCDSSTKTCATSCADGGSCAPGMTCVDGKCVYPRTFCKDDHTSANSAGATRDCYNYSCDSWSGLCYTVCENGSDCAKGFSCNSDRVCVPG